MRTRERKGVPLSLSCIRKRCKNMKKMYTKIIVAILSLTVLLSGAVFFAGNDFEVKAEEVTDTSKSVLDVKFQLSKDKTVMRFISSVDSLNYSAVGFEVTYDGLETPLKNHTQTVFERIESNYEGAEYEFSPKVVSVDSEYFVTAKMNVTQGIDYTVKAYAISPDGQTKTYGMSRTVAVEDAAEDNTVNIAFASKTKVGEQTELSVTYGENNTETKAEVISSDGETISVRVNNVDEASLKSATLFNFTGAASGSAIYRNLYTKYNGNNADTSWYSVYEDAGYTEYVIATDADMYGFASVVETEDKLLDKKVYLVSDISLNEGRPVLQSNNTVVWKYDTLVDANADGVEDRTPYNWNPIGTNGSAPFQGTFDGQGHTISGLNSNAYNAKVGGMFEYTDANSTVCDFNFIDSYVYVSEDYAGSIVGKSSGIIEDIYTNAIVQTKKNKAQSITGGIIGTYEAIPTNDTAHGISRCWFDGAVLSIGYYNGGIVGYSASYQANCTMTVEDCLVTGIVNGYSHTGGIVGMSPASSNCSTFTINLNNCVSSGTYTTTGASACGALIGGIQNKTTNIKSSYATNDCGTNFKKLYGEKGSSSVIDVTDSAATNLVSRASISGTNASTILGLSEENSAWTFTDDVPELKIYAKHAYDISWYNDNDSEFTISTAAELYGFAFLSRSKNFAGQTIKLADDIVLNEGNAEEWSNGHTVGLKRWWSIGINGVQEFAGTFDGQGHTISGLYGTYSTICQGLFATVGQGGCVTNLRLLNSYLTSTTGYLGSIAGRSNGGSFSKIYSNATVKATGSYSIDDNRSYIGGIAGTAIGTTDGVDDILFSECWFAGKVDSASMRNGGIVGSVNASGTSTETMYIQDCLFTGAVISTNMRHGARYGTAGIVGCMTGEDSPLLIKNGIAIDNVDVSGAYDGTKICQFAGALLGATASYASTKVSVENSYVIGDNVDPVGIESNQYFIGDGGKINGSAIVVDSLEDASNITSVSSAWKIVKGKPVLKEFENLAQ